MDKYKTIICEQEFIWRELTRKEFTKIIEIEDSFVRDEYVCKTCVLSPVNYDYDNAFAGIASVLSKEIVEISGFSEKSGELEYERHRQELTSFENQIPLIICAAFPRLLPEDIDEWSMKKTIWYLAQAEIVLGIRGTPISIDVNDEADYDAFPELLQEKRFLKG